MDKIKEKTSFIKDIKYEICIFVFLMINLIVRLKPGIESWKATYYAMNYSYGVIPRGFIGTIFCKIFNGNISELNAWWFILFFTVVLNCLIAILFGKIIKSTPQRRRPTNYGRLDLFLYIITIIQILILFRFRGLASLFICGVLSLICVAIHEAYICFVFPITFVVIMYNIYKKDFDLKYIVATLIVGIAIGISTIYFQFFAQINVNSLDEMMKILNEKTDLDINVQTLSLEYFDHTLDAHNEFTAGYFDRNVFGSVFVLALLFPVICIIIALRRMLLKKAKKLNPKLYWTIFIMRLAILVYIPLFCTTSDWGRWLIGLVNYELAIIIFMICENSEGLVFLKKVRNYCNDNKFAFIAYLIFVF